MTSIVSIFVRSITGAALVAALASASPASAADAPDIWITTKVKMALLMAPDVSATAVRVDTTEGKVTLHGTVSSADEKARAERAAAGVEGAREVRNLLQVVDEPRQESMAVADQALSAEVQKRLGADPALQKSSIGVKSVNQGVVLLEGEAPTLSTHLHALAVARAVPGVKQVASEIESPDTLADDEIWRDAKSDPMAPVAASMRDAWITTEAKVRLIANPDTSARDINVDTVGGRRDPLRLRAHGGRQAHGRDGDPQSRRREGRRERPPDRAARVGRRGRAPGRAGRGRRRAAAEGA